MKFMSLGFITIEEKCSVMPTFIIWGIGFFGPILVGRFFAPTLG